MNRAQEIALSVENDCTGWPCDAIMELASRVAKQEAETSKYKMLLAAIIRRITTGTREPVIVSGKELDACALVNTVQSESSTTVWVE